MLVIKSKYMHPYIYPKDLTLVNLKSSKFYNTFDLNTDVMFSAFLDKAFNSIIDSLELTLKSKGTKIIL